MSFGCRVNLSTPSTELRGVLWAGFIKSTSTIATIVLTILKPTTFIESDIHKVTLFREKVKKRSSEKSDSKYEDFKEKEEGRQTVMQEMHALHQEKQVQKVGQFTQKP